MGCGSAPVGDELVEMAEARTKIPIRGCYGLTESTCVVATRAYKNSKQGCVGKLNPNMSAKLVEGQLYLKGPNITKGYLNNPDADKDNFTEDGWFKTGDICRFDEDGDLFVVDRLKEVSSIRSVVI